MTYGPGVKDAANMEALRDILRFSRLSIISQVPSSNITI